MCEPRVDPRWSAARRPRESSSSSRWRSRWRATYRPFGDYMARVFESEKHLAPGAVAIYRVARIDPSAEQTWGVYLRSVLAFSLVSVLVLYAFLRVQHRTCSVSRTPFRRCPPASRSTPRRASSPTPTGSPTPARARSATSSQTAGLAVQNFVSAAVGIAVAVALVRGFTRNRTDRLGNFWVDLTRICIRILLPISFVVAHRADRRRRDRELPRTTGRSPARRRHADDHRRPCRQPGGDQGARHERRRLLQRQLLAPVREPDGVDELVRDLPAAVRSASRCPGPSAGWSATSARAARSSP